MSRVIVWYSDGAASACAAVIALVKYKARVEVVKCDTTGDEHPDNLRFRAEVEEWIGTKIKLIRSEKYSGIDDVFMRRRYMSGVRGAPCTYELKREVRYAYQRPDDLHVFGYTVDEKRRIRNLTQNEWDIRCDFPLHDLGITKEECYAVLGRAGIRLPRMYELGFPNNNCIGCAKAQSVSYWNKVREHFPDVFERRAMQSRELGVKLVKIKGQRVPLDDLPRLTPESTPLEAEDFDCGPFCSTNP